MEDRYTAEMKLWLFDLAHGNQTNQDQIVKGFIKHYALHGFGVGNVQQDIVFHTAYGISGVEKAMDALNNALQNFTESSQIV